MSIKYLAALALVIVATLMSAIVPLSAVSALTIH